MPLGNYVAVCPNCDLVAPTADLTPCTECGKKGCADCLVPTSDPHLSACSRSCQIKADLRFARESEPVTAGAQ